MNENIERYRSVVNNAGCDWIKRFDGWDHIVQEYEYTLPLCNVIIREILIMMGLASDKSKITISNYEAKSANRLRELDITFLAFFPKVDGIDIGKRIKCSIGYKHFCFYAKGAFVENSDGTGPVDFYGYDDWTDPNNPRLIYTGRDE